MPYSRTPRATGEVISRVSHWTDELLQRSARVVSAARRDAIVISREDYESFVEAMEIVSDPEVMEDLRMAALTPDEEARDYDEVRREIGLA